MISDAFQQREKKAQLYIHLALHTQAYRLWNAEKLFIFEGIGTYGAGSLADEAIEHLRLMKFRF